MDESLRAAIQHMKNGEERGFNEVYSKTYNRVYFRAKMLMGDEDDAQDLTQVVFIEAYKNIGSLEAPEALYSWLDGIAYRQGMKVFRKKRDVLLTEDAELVFDMLESNDISSMPELTADQKAVGEIVKEIIEELPGLQRTAVVMYYYDGMKLEQIADHMECSVNTIKSRLNYARKYIKSRVEETEREQGIRLHALGLPVLWFSIRLLVKETTLTMRAAQAVFNGTCKFIGLQAAMIKDAADAAAEGETSPEAESGSVSDAESVTEPAPETEPASETGTAPEAESGSVSDAEPATEPAEATLETGTPPKAETAGSAGEAGTPTAAETAGSAGGAGTTAAAGTTGGVATGAGTAAAAAGATILVKVLIVAVIVVVGAGGAYAVTHNRNSEEAIYEETEEDQTWVEETAEEIPEEVVVEEEAEAEEGIQELTEVNLTEEAARQLSGFVGTLQMDHGEYEDISTLTADECLILISDYYIYTTHHGNRPEESSLPYDWSNRNITPEEFKTFVGDVLDVQVSNDYSYRYDTEWGAYWSVANGILEMESDPQSISIIPGTAQIEGQDGENIVVTGTYTVMDPDGETEHSFMLNCVPSGNPELFGGLKIQSIGEAEGSGMERQTRTVDFQLMAEKCIELMEQNIGEDGMSESYCCDIDHDNVPELIVRQGNYSYEMIFVVYRFDGQEMQKIGELMYGTALYASPDVSGVLVQLQKMAEYDDLYIFNSETLSFEEPQELFDGPYDYEEINEYGVHVSDFEVPDGFERVWAVRVSLADLFYEQYLKPYEQ